MTGRTYTILDFDCTPLAANSDLHTPQESKRFSEEEQPSEKKGNQVARSEGLILMEMYLSNLAQGVG